MGICGSRQTYCNLGLGSLFCFLQDVTQNFYFYPNGENHKGCWDFSLAALLELQDWSFLVWLPCAFGKIIGSPSTSAYYRLSSPHPRCLGAQVPQIPDWFQLWEYFHLMKYFRGQDTILSNNIYVLYMCVCIYIVYKLYIIDYRCINILYLYIYVVCVNICIYKYIYKNVSYIPMHLAYIT